MTAKGDKELEWKIVPRRSVGPLRLGDKSFLGGRVADVVKRLRKRDPRADVDGYDVKSPALCLAMGLPTSPRRIRSLAVHGPSYYRKRHRLHLSVSRRGLIGSAAVLLFSSPRAELHEDLAKAGPVSKGGRDREVPKAKANARSIASPLHGLRCDLRGGRVVALRVFADPAKATS